MTPGERLKRFRDSKKWSQTELAEKLDCDQSFIGLVERGKRMPKGAKFTHRLQELTADWDGGQISTEEWLAAEEAADAKEPTASSESGETPAVDPEKLDARTVEA